MLMRNSARDELQARFEHPHPRPTRFGWLRYLRDETLVAFAAALLVVLFLIAVMLAFEVFQPGADGPIAPNVSTQAVNIALGDGGLAMQNLSDQNDTVLQQQQIPTDGPQEDIKQANVQQVGNLSSTTPQRPVDTGQSDKTAQSAKTLAEQLGGKIAGGQTQGGGRPLSGIFKIDPKYESVVYVIDKSGSMSGYPIHAVKAELVEGIRSLQEDQKFHVIFFDNTTWTMFSSYGSAATGNSKPIGLYQATEENKKKVQQWLGRQQGNGGTNPFPAMMLALAAKPQLIMLLSDGQFHPANVQQIEQTNKRQGKMTVIDCIGLSEDIQTLEDIASQNGGIYYQARLRP